VSEPVYEGDSRVRVDLREIAKRTKLSIATVSRTINRIPSVDPLLAKRVWRVVKELGYYPNTQARALVSGRSRIFGLIVSEISNPSFAELIQSFEEIAADQGYEIILTSTAQDPERMDLAVRRLVQRSVDGVAVLTFGAGDSAIAHLRKHRVPVTFIHSGEIAENEGRVQIDYRNGIRQAIEHLAALQHTRIALITGPPSLHSAIVRKDVFQQCMRKLDLKVSPELIIEGDHTAKGGVRAFGALAALRERPSAVFCSNDLTAMGLISEASNRGFLIPKDLSVVGFDDICLAEFSVPPLTTIQMSQATLAEYAFKTLRNIVEDRPAKSFELATSLLIRKSTTFAPRCQDAVAYRVN
jgi:DNA-binding LacI/PurR family transcriptional regulator